MVSLSFHTFIKRKYTQEYLGRISCDSVCFKNEDAKLSKYGMRVNTSEIVEGSKKKSNIIYKILKQLIKNISKENLQKV